MYHLYTEDDKKSAIKEAIRVTKKDGIIFVAYCNNDMTVYDFGFLRGGFKNEYYKKLTDFNTFKLNSNPQEIFALYRKEDVDALYFSEGILSRFIASPCCIDIFSQASVFFLKISIFWVISSIASTL